MGMFLNAIGPWRELEAEKARSNVLRSIINKAEERWITQEQALDRALEDLGNLRVQTVIAKEGHRSDDAEIKQLTADNLTAKTTISARDATIRVLESNVSDEKKSTASVGATLAELRRTLKETENKRLYANSQVDKLAFKYTTAHEKLGKIAKIIKE